MSKNFHDYGPNARGGDPIQELIFQKGIERVMSGPVWPRTDKFHGWVTGGRVYRSRAAKQWAKQALFDYSGGEILDFNDWDQEIHNAIDMADLLGFSVDFYSGATKPFGVVPMEVTID